jgi:hypothetical protein
MIEVEYNDVCLAAVDARVSPKVLADQGPVLNPITVDPADFLSDVGIPVSEVMLSSVPRVTCTAPSLPCALRFVVIGELGDQLHEPAVVATLGLEKGDRHEGPLRSGSALRSA